MRRSISGLKSTIMMSWWQVIITSWSQCDMLCCTDRRETREEAPVADKTMTLRLPEPQAEALETVAEIEGVPVVEVVRLAVSE